MEGSSVLVLTAFSIFFLEMGTLKSFGVLFNPMLESLQCSTAQLGTVLGITHSLGLILAPITGNIARKCDNRLCVIIGGVLLLVGYLASAFVGNVYQLAITLGITGVGFGLTYVPQNITLLAAFPTRFSLVYGYATMGGSLGMMVCPPIVELLTSSYGWRGTMVIIAAANFNVCAFGAVQKLPPEVYTRIQTSDGNSEPDAQSRSKLSQVATSVAKWLSLYLCVDEPKVLLHFTVWILQGMIFSAWMVFLVPHVIARGIPVGTAVFSSTAGGIGHLLGRAISPPLLDRELISAFWMFVGLSLVDTVAFLLDYVAMNNYLALLALACVNGAAIGTTNVINISVSKELFKDRYIMDISLIGVCLFGFGEIIGDFLAGVLYDLTQSYDASFFALGLMAALTTVLTLADRFVTCCSSN